MLLPTHASQPTNSTESATFTRCHYRPPKATHALKLVRTSACHHLPARHNPLARHNLLVRHNLPACHNLLASNRVGSAVKAHPIGRRAPACYRIRSTLFVPSQSTYPLPLHLPAPRFLQPIRPGKPLVTAVTGPKQVSSVAKTTSPICCPPCRLFEPAARLSRALCRRCGSPGASEASHDGFAISRAIRPAKQDDPVPRY